MAEVIAVSKISTKSLVHVPKDVLSILGVKSGDKIQWVLKDGEIIVRKSKTLE